MINPSALPRAIVPCGLLLLATAVGGAADPPRGKTVLGIAGTRFTLNRQPVFLYGCSYYGALGAADDFIRLDLDEMQRHGFNWIRVWATWAAFSNNVAAVDGEGAAREPYLTKLKDLVAECDRRGMVIDVTLSRGNGVTGSPRLQAKAAHRRAVETIVGALRPWPNWYLDLGNERNIRDQRHTSIEDLRALRARAREMDPERLVTASHAGDISAAEVRDCALTVGVDFLSPHRPRDAKSPAQTREKTLEYLRTAKELGRVVPVHYQEPFRRGFGGWEPKAEDFAADLRGAVAGGAAGWCFHNGDTRGQKDGKPARSFDLREKRLFDQLDDEERKAVELMGGIVKAAK